MKSILYKILKGKDNMKNEKLLKDLGNKTKEELDEFALKFTELLKSKNEEDEIEEELPEDEESKEELEEKESKEEKYKELEEKFNGLQTYIDDKLEDLLSNINKELKTKPIGVQKKLQKDKKLTTVELLEKEVMERVNKIR